MPFYAVKQGKVKDAIFESWPECQAVVKGVPYACFKKFPTEDAARQWLGLPCKPTPSDGVLRIYTDGCCRDFGKNGAGIGVYFGPRDSRNVAQPLTKADGYPTNNKAELKAIWKALTIVQQQQQADLQTVHVYTDSQYCVSVLTKWAAKWAVNGWVTSSGTPVANQTLIKRITTVLNDLLQSGVDVKLMHVKGHANIPGNEAADRLANQGADEYKRS